MAPRRTRRQSGRSGRGRRVGRSTSAAGRPNGAPSRSRSPNGQRRSPSREQNPIREFVREFDAADPRGKDAALRGFLFSLSEVFANPRPPIRPEEEALYLEKAATWNRNTVFEMKAHFLPRLEEFCRRPEFQVQGDFLAKNIARSWTGATENDKEAFLDCFFALPNSYPENDTIIPQESAFIIFWIFNEFF